MTSPYNGLPVAIYVGESSTRQASRAQRIALEAIATERGWVVTAVYEEKPVKGSMNRDGRPALMSLLAAAAQRRFSLVLVWSVEQIGKSLQDLMELLNKLRQFRIGLFLLAQGFDTTTSSGSAFYNMLDVLSDFEAVIFRERVKAGLQKARERGAILGRPKVPAAVLRKVARHLAAGRSIRDAARLSDVSIGLAHRVSRLERSS